MTDLIGSWSQKRRKFRVYLDPAEIEAQFEELFASAFAMDVDVNVRKGVFKGNEKKKHDAIKGVFSLSMDMYLAGQPRPAKVKAISRFQGTPGGGPLSLRTNSVQPGWRALLETVTEKLEEVMQTFP